MKKMMLISVLALVFSVGANGAEKKKATKVAKAQILKLDKSGSTVKWMASKKIGSAHNGTITVKDGQIEMRDGNIVGGNIVIDMASIQNEDLKGSPDFQKKLVGHLSSADFFNVEKFPTSTFKITGAEKKSDTDWVIKGELTMIGQTQPVEVPAKIASSESGMTGEAKLKLDRTKWGLKYGSGNFFKELAADKIINDEIELDLKLSSKKG